jgi:hypothetical protein
MLFELIAAFAAGLALAGIAMGLRWLSRGRLPKWIIPASAGLGMLAFAIWSEYSWFDRVSNTLPNATVVWKNEDSSMLRPWSFLRPVVTRLTAVDHATVQRHENFPDQVMIDVILWGRWQPPVRAKMAFDCATHQRADLMGSDVSIAENGSIVGATWLDLPEDDPALVAACKRS